MSRMLKSNVPCQVRKRRRGNDSGVGRHAKSAESSPLGSYVGVLTFPLGDPAHVCLAHQITCPLASCIFICVTVLTILNV